MGQWGKTYRVNGAEFLVHLDTGGPFNTITDNSIVDMFLESSSSGDRDRDAETWYNLRKAFIGKKLQELDAWYEEYQDRDVVKTKSKSPWAR